MTKKSSCRLEQESFLRAYQKDPESMESKLRFCLRGQTPGFGPFKEEKQSVVSKTKRFKDKLVKRDFHKESFISWLREIDIDHPFWTDAEKFVADIQNCLDDNKKAKRSKAVVDKYSAISENYGAALRFLEVDWPSVDDIIKENIDNPIERLEALAHSLKKLDECRNQNDWPATLSESRARQRKLESIAQQCQENVQNLRHSPCEMAAETSIGKTVVNSPTKNFEKEEQTVAENVGAIEPLSSSFIETLEKPCQSIKGDPAPSTSAKDEVAQALNQNNTTQSESFEDNSISLQHEDVRLCEELSRYRDECNELNHKLEQKETLLRQQEEAWTEEKQRIIRERDSHQRVRAGLERHLESVRGGFPGMDDLQMFFKNSVGKHANEQLKIRNLEEALRIIEIVFPNNVMILKTAKNSAREAMQFYDPQKAFFMMIRLVTDYRDAIEKDGDSSAKKLFSDKEFAGTECDSVSRERRTFEGRILLKHLKIGKGESPTNGWRCYFDYDAQNKKIVIGHCGKHLDFQ